MLPIYELYSYSLNFYNQYALDSQPPKIIEEMEHPDQQKKVSIIHMRYKNDIFFN